MKMGLGDFEAEIRRRHPQWQLHESESGLAKWIDIRISMNSGFTIQVTPNDGVGVSRIPRENALDFGGHDDVFDDLSDALHYIENWGK
jgi:hypothetical protein